MAGATPPNSASASASTTIPVTTTTVQRPTSLLPPIAVFDSPGPDLESSTVNTEAPETDFKKQLLNDVSNQNYDFSFFFHIYEYSTPITYSEFFILFF